ncbi:UDP-N-acetylenolpyruvoylglucosamine reductase [Brumimicrobium salinarum]|uniref:UDP-N-acetylenolpyruvoylglucosamine reductase n=1 Tax=Brumimicrobium salinarum TaxID=2058658 RepID=A0A2I0R3W9_9FLAO|nr:UDP-N-acetylmuramate dehydrogenase [Brumimicrobium salinarum]PKR81090.1 UDP-N-acetylenolpyruvoylglucosamine reductase [Brumimicrobium salinarum]
MLKENVSLKNFNTFGMDVQAKLYAPFTDVYELQELLKSTSEQPLLILGGGSNVLFQSDFDGIVLHNKIKGIEVISEDDKTVLIKVGAGEIWHDLVMHTITQNWAGIENLSLIPGSVGASPMQNIGAYGVEIKDVFESLEAVEIKTGKLREFTHAECQFGYRESVFKKALKDQYVITSVSYRLSKNPKLNTSYGAIETELQKKGIDQPTIKDVSNAVISIRKSKLPNPKEIGNAGSFFKNPVILKTHHEELRKVHPEIPAYPVSKTEVKVPAGWLIDQAGWKGKTFNNYGVHKKQALVLVNYKDAKGADIVALSNEIIADIITKFNIKLEREVNIID